MKGDILHVHQTLINQTLINEEPMRRKAAILLFAAFLTSSTLMAQAAPQGETVIGSGNFSPIVRDLDKSLEFYRALLGVAPPANAAPIAFSTDAALLNFLGVPTAQLRFSTVRIPGTTMSVEIVEFKDIDRKAVQPRMQDPGAAWLLLSVRDIDTLFARLKKDGVPVVTASGGPVNVQGGGEKGRGVVIKDPDGFNIVLVQEDPLPQTTAPESSNVIGARVGLTVADTDRTIAFYRDVLGFQPRAGTFTTDAAVADLMNTPKAQFRRSTARIPGSAIQMEFLEFKGIDRKPAGARIQDPGSTRFQLRVRDTDAAVKALKAAGGVVITTGGDGGPIDMRGLRVALVREPNNLFLVIMSQAQR